MVEINVLPKKAGDLFARTKTEGKACLHCPLEGRAGRRKNASEVIEAPAEMLTPGDWQIPVFSPWSLFDEVFRRAPAEGGLQISHRAVDAVVCQMPFVAQ